MITTTKNDTSTDGELLVATNGIVISSDMFIICDEYGDPCEIFEANYGYSVRGLYGTYPVEIKIVPVNP